MVSVRQEKQPINRRKATCSAGRKFDNDTSGKALISTIFTGLTHWIANLPPSNSEIRRRIWTDICLKNRYKWVIVIWKWIQHHQSSRTYMFKPSGGGMSLHICENDCCHKRRVSAGEDVEQRKCLFVLMPLTQLLWKEYGCLLES